MGIYNNRDHSKKGGGEVAKKKREAQRKEGGSCVTERGWGFPSSSEGSLLPGTLGRLILCVFSPPKQVVALSEPNFWTHSLQIHCIGPSPKTATLQLVPSVGKLLMRR